MKHSAVGGSVDLRAYSQALCYHNAGTIRNRCPRPVSAHCEYVSEIMGRIGHGGVLISDVLNV